MKGSKQHFLMVLYGTLCYAHHGGFNSKSMDLGRSRENVLLGRFSSNFYCGQVINYLFQK